MRRLVLALALAGSAALAMPGSAQAAQPRVVSPLSMWPVLWLGLIAMIVLWVAMEIRLPATGPYHPDGRAASLGGARRTANVLAPIAICFTAAYVAAEGLCRARTGQGAPWSTVEWGIQVVVLLVGYLAALVSIRVRVAASTGAEAPRVARWGIIAAAMALTTVGLWLFAGPLP